MAIYVLIGDACRKDARKHAYEKELENFAAKVEKTQSLDLFDRFPPPYLKKRFERQVRLVASERFYEDHTVVCFLRVLIRGSSDYDGGFTKNTKSWGEKNLEPLISAEEIRVFMVKKLEVSPLPEKRKPTPPEYDYLYTALNSSANPYADIVCCESSDWVCRVTAPDLRNRIALFADAIYEAIFGENKAWQEVRLKSNDDLSFLCRLFPEKKKLFLLAPLTAETRHERDALLEKNRDIMTRPQEEIEEEDILRTSARAYTATVLDDSKLWTDIQMDERGNMALSFEEVEVLESARRPEAFPLFINGRAGSGKSTILQYLFAEYLHCHLSREFPFPLPLYFTCSRELLAIARQSVEKLIHSRQRLAGGDPAKWDARLATATNAAFQEFHSFLYSLLPEGGHQRFPRANYVNYAQFKRLWEAKYAQEPRARNLYGPDISWHVIRTYIKGSNSERYLEPEDYDELPNKQKSVSGDTYRIVSDRVWGKWYSQACAEGRMWDDQDLVREILSQGLALPKYPAVFCDEAQDFTRIELALLFRLSLFSDRSIGGGDLARVPFSFAGDPFQTLNPTGFRWEATKASFVENFILKQDPQQRAGKQDLNYRELSYNYRSSKYIVRFCNCIQLLRSIVFDLPEIRPQTPYQVESDPAQVVYFPRTDSKALERLSKESEIRVIVPCEEDEEQAFVEGDEFLKGVIGCDDTGVPKNVISPVRAKGLEFPRVVLYGFGDACPPGLIEAIKTRRTDLTADQALPFEYFINRVYVAASRPKRRLIIIDSPKAIETFWAFIFDEKRRELLHDGAKNPEIWKEKLAGAVIGRPDSWESDREKPEETARTLEEEGLAREDPFFLRQAAQSYENAGNSRKVTECRARAFFFEQNYLEAGKLFEEIDQADEALKAFWIAGDAGWKAIENLAAEVPSVKVRLEYRLAHFLSNPRSFDEGLDVLLRFVECLTDPTMHARIVSEKPWGHAISEFYRHLIDVGETSAGEGSWQVVCNHTDRVVQKGARVDARHIAVVRYLAGDRKGAYEAWQTVPAAERPESKYLDAKATALPYPGNLIAFGELQERGIEVAESIIVAFEAGGSTDLTTEHWAIVVNAYLRAKRVRDAYVHARRCSSFGDLLRLGLALLEDGKVTHASALIYRAVQVKVIAERWADLAVFIGFVPADFERICGPASTPLLRARWAFTGAAVRWLARSDAFARSSENSVKTQVSEALWRVLKDERSVWHKHFSMLEAGAVLERAGLDRNTLPYYELVESGQGFSEPERREGAMRWLKAKEGQVKRERTEGKRDRGDKHWKEAMSKAEKMDVRDISTIPEFPVLPGFSIEFPDYFEADQILPVPPRDVAPIVIGETDGPLGEPVGEKVPVSDRSSTPGSIGAAEQKKLEFAFGKLRFHYFPNDGRLVIRDEDALEQVTVRIPERVVKGDHDFEQDGADQNVLVCRAWALSLDLTLLESDGAFSIRFGDTGTDIRLPFNSKKLILKA